MLAGRHLPLTLLAGLAVIAVAEALLFIDVAARGGAVLPHEPLPPPEGALQALGRWVSLHMTPVVWLAFLMVLDGLLEMTPDGSPARRRPRRFVFCFLASVPIWLWFDWVNFSFVHAWAYHGLPEATLHRYLMYFAAFGAICPAMFLTAEVIRRLGLGRLTGRPLRLGPGARRACVGVGAALLVFPFAVREPTGTLTMWLAWILILEPLNRRLGAPSLLADWEAGRYGRTVALLAAGLACGLLWEFWNYWAAAKWTYDLPFLGPLEAVRFFEMPVVGLLGFPPFAIECWAMFQTLAWGLGRLRRRLIEPPPGPAANPGAVI